MKNIVSNGEKLPEILKIMPSSRNFGKAVTLAIMLALSGCRNVNHYDPIDTPREWAIGEEEIVNDTITHIHHPDYIIQENSANYYSDSLAFPDKETSIEKTVIIKSEGKVYLRLDGSDHHTYVGSDNPKDSIESDLGQGVVVIQGPLAK